MGLQKHSNANSNGDNLKVGEHLNKVFIVNPTELIKAFDTKAHKVVLDDKGETKERYLRANAYDVSEGRAYVNVVFFNPGIVDQLKQYVNDNGDDATVVRFVSKESKNGKNYTTVAEATDDEYETASGVDYETAFTERKAELDSKAPAEEATEAKRPTQSAAQKAKVEAAFSRS